MTFARVSASAVAQLSDPTVLTIAALVAAWLLVTIVVIAACRIAARSDAELEVPAEDEEGNTSVVRLARHPSPTSEPPAPKHVRHGA
jgi:hypothetical protein